jgi:hypothetical protein
MRNKSMWNKEIRIKNKIVAFSGLMHSGKTTCAEILETHLAMSIYYPKMIKFAQPLYDIQNYVYERTRLEKPKTKDRELLQYLGTEWGRKKDTDLWINLWRQEVRTYRFKTSSMPDDVHIVICDDLRFENEARQVKELGGIVINVTAPDEIRHERNPSAFLNTGHSSEKPLPEELIDLNIYNAQDVADLRYNIRYLLEDGLI